MKKGGDCAIRPDKLRRLTLVLFYAYAHVAQPSATLHAPGGQISRFIWGGSLKKKNIWNFGPFFGIPEPWSHPPSGNVVGCFREDFGSLPLHHWANPSHGEGTSSMVVPGSDAFLRPFWTLFVLLWHFQPHIQGAVPMKFRVLPIWKARLYPAGNCSTYKVIWGVFTQRSPGGVSVPLTQSQLPLFGGSAFSAHVHSAYRGGEPEQRDLSLSLQRNWQGGLPRDHFLLFFSACSVNSSATTLGLSALSALSALHFSLSDLP